MNRPDTKLVLVMFLVGAISLYAETCPQNHYQLGESLCCSICPTGSYVGRNCSNGPGGDYYGVQCNPCSRCEDAELRTVSNCTLFSNTQCAVIEEAPQPHNRKLPELIMYGCFSAAAAVVVLALILSTCFCRRSSKSGGCDESCAGESFHLEDAETV